MVNKLEEDENDRRKEIGLIKNQLQKVAYIILYVSINLRLIKANKFHALVNKRLYNFIFQEREELRSQAERDSKMILQQVDKDCNDLMTGMFTKLIESF